MPGVAEPALRHARRDRHVVGRRLSSSRCTSTSRATSSSASRAWRPPGGRRRQSAGASGGHARHRRVGEGRALRPLLRRVQHPARHLRGRARVPARHGQEYGGIIRHGAKLLYAFAEATVPKVTVITRKAYGGAYCVMSSKHIRTDVQLRLADGRDRGDGRRGRGQHPLQARARCGRRRRRRPARARIAEYREKFANPYVAAERGFIDEVIRPRQTRAKLIAALRRELGNQARSQSAQEARQHSACEPSHVKRIDKHPHRQPRRDRRARHPRLPRDGLGDGGGLLRLRSRRRATCGWPTRRITSAEPARRELPAHRPPHRCGECARRRCGASRLRISVRERGLRRGVRDAG